MNGIGLSTNRCRHPNGWRQFLQNVPGQLSETVSSEGFACFRFEMSTKKALSAAKKLAGYCRENKIDVIHAQYPMENVIAILSRLFYRKVKVVYTSHLTIYQNTKWKILNRLFTPFDHRIIAVCRCKHKPPKLRRQYERQDNDNSRNNCNYSEKRTRTFTQKTAPSTRIL